jgi:hypothetical protein
MDKDPVRNRRHGVRGRRHLNDGGMPGIDEEEGLIVPAGMRGVVVHFGVAEMDESKEIYLVQFENGPDGSLGAPGRLPARRRANPRRYGRRSKSWQKSAFSLAPTPAAPG